MQLTDRINDFTALIAKGIESWIVAGKLLVEMLDADPCIRVEILEKCPEINRETLSRFEQLGRGNLHPKLMFAGAPGLVQLRKCPLSEQERFLADPFAEVLTPAGETLRVDVSDLDRFQAAQVFDKDGHRSIAAQKNYIEARSRKSKQRETPPEYKVSGNKVTFYSGTTLDRKQLAALLAKLV